MRNHAYSELTKIVHPHVVELIHSGYNLEDTMPVGKGNALVIAFDVMGSSRIQSRKFPEALDRVIARCHAAMMEDYSASPLSARAFPVKDLGDGFLASIGFPFALPAGRSAVENALQLAEAFVEIFDEEMAKIDLDEPAYCCVSIVSGGVEGYFPRAGVKQYELRVHSLVLATRYEGMRKYLLPRLNKNGNFIILRECVYQGLSSDQQRSFSAWDVRSPGMGVRDDPHAKMIYYRFVDSAESGAEQTEDPEEHLPSVA